MRALLLATIVAAITGNLPSSPNQSATAHKNGIEKQQPSQPTAVIENYECTEPASTAAPQTPKGYATPEWVLVFVGIATCIVIAWQSFETRRSANASEKNVEAIRTAERAWIIGSIGKTDNLTAWKPEINQFEIFWLAPVIQNFGRTPGRITRIRAKVLFLTPDEPMQSEANYELTYQHDRTNDGCFIDEVLLIPNASFQPVRVGFNGADFIKVKQDNFRMFVCGVIDYRDIPGNAFYSRFCYQYQIPHGYNPMPEGFYVGGPTGYNKAT